jgi:hypothetical protein
MIALRTTLILTAFTVLATALIVGPAPGASKEKTPRQKTPPPEPVMKVYVVTSAQDGCEPNCPQWIAAHGQIVEGSLAQFKKALRQIGKKSVPVLIHSGGGLSEQAMAIGRLIRDKGLDVAVAKTAFTPCAPDDSACRKKAGKRPLRGLPDQSLAICASSCSFILAAGKRRFVRAPAFVGVHRGQMILQKIRYTYRMTPYRGRDGSIRYKKRILSQKVISRKRTDTSDRFLDRYEDYFAEMGIGEEIMELLAETPNDAIHWLTDDQLRSTRIATHRLSGEQLIQDAAISGDGWLVPSGPIITLPRAVQTDCGDNGLNCPSGVEAAPLSGGRRRSAPVPSVLTGPILPSAAARECARTGAGCSWEFTPAAPSRPTQ